jgi:hypothetical protein
MFLRKQSVLGPRQVWLAVLIVMVACSLTINVATRYCFATTTHVSFEKSANAQAEGIQHPHLDKDGLSWVSPLRRPVIYQVSTFYPRFAPSGPPVHTLLSDNSLYNRPPPSA